MVTLRNILFDKDSSESSKYLGTLPEWDLNDLYTNTQSLELEADLNWLEKECKLFAADFQGQLVDLSASEFLNCVKRNEKISNVSGRLISYAGLRYYQCTTDGERTKFLSDIQEKITICLLYTSPSPRD